MTEKQPEDLIKLRKLSYALNMHYVDHIIRCYKAFNGDLESCIILGEISHYNTKSIVGLFNNQDVERDEALTHLRGCNAYSISMSTGIPRETVRRKIKKLEHQGFITINDKNQILLTNKPIEHFSEFGKQTLEKFRSFLTSIENEI